MGVHLQRLEQHEFLAASLGEVLYSRLMIVRSRIPKSAEHEARNQPWQIVFLVLGRSRLEESKMKLLTKAVAGAAIGVGVLAASAVSASAAIVCSGNVCWHTHERYEYPATAGVVVHEDDWKWGPSEKFTFREHEGRGYWRGDTWTSW
jgi:hypothetical protein